MRITDQRTEYSDIRMSRPVASPDSPSVPLGEFGQYVMKLIVDNPLPGETAASRMKQIGMMTIMHHMAVTGIETTATNIVKNSGISRPSLSEVLQPLVDRKLLREEIRRNALGHGKVLVYHFDDALSEAMSAMLQPVADLPKT